VTFNPLCATAVASTLEILPERPTVLELGNQTFSVPPKALASVIASLQPRGPEVVERLTDLAAKPRAEQLTESYYRALGFTSYTAIDVNSRYGSTIMDLNRDVVVAYDFQQTFDLVTNFGTGEHIFDQRQVYENIHNLTTPNGVMLHIMPFVNWLNHGFYNFHPVLYADLAAANGYRIHRLSLADSRGYEVAADLDAASADRVAKSPGRASGTRKAARLYRDVRRTLSRPPPPPGLALRDAVAPIQPSASAPDEPLPKAIDAVMSNARIHTDSDYPVMGNVLLVASLQKCSDAPFVVPMAGRYLEDIEDENVGAAYAAQQQVEGTDPFA
jgi:hypothetical protein